MNTRTNGGFFRNMLPTGLGGNPSEEEEIGDGNTPPIEEEEEEEVQLNPLGKLFAEEEEEEDEEKEITPDPNAKPKKTPEEEMAANLQNMLKGITVGENDIPDDFDPSDKKQLRDLLTKTQQAAAQQTLAMTMQPMRMALESLTTAMRQEIRDALGGLQTQNASEAALSALVPEVNDPNLGPMVKTLHAQAAKKEKSPQKQAQMVRAALNAMNIKPRAGHDSDPSSAGFRSGTDALDMFAPLPKRKAAGAK